MARVDIKKLAEQLGVDVDLDEPEDSNEESTSPNAEESALAQRLEAFEARMEQQLNNRLDKVVSGVRDTVRNLTEAMPERTVTEGQPPDDFISLFEDPEKTHEYFKGLISSVVNEEVGDKFEAVDSLSEKQQLEQAEAQLKSELESAVKQYGEDFVESTVDAWRPLVEKGGQSISEAVGMVRTLRGDEMSSNDETGSNEGSGDSEFEALQRKEERLSVETEDVSGGIAPDPSDVDSEEEAIAMAVREALGGGD